MNALTKAMVTEATDTEEDARIVRAVLRARGVPTAGIDDAVQRVFLVAARRGADVRAGSERGFLVGIAERIAREEWRPRREVASDTIDEVPRDEPLADELLRRQERAQAVQRGLADLSPDLRSVIVRADMHEEPASKIAAELGLPVGTVASRLRRGRAQLVKRLTNERGQPALLSLFFGLFQKPRAWFAKSQLATYVAGGAVVIGAAAAGFIVATERSNTPGAVVSGLSAPALAAAPNASPAAALASTRPEESTTPVVSVDALPRAGAEPLARPPAPSAATPPLVPSELERESADLRRAQALLVLGDAQDAAKLTTNWRASHPGGALAEEAAAVEIDALAKSAQGKRACERAEVFIKLWPKSMHAARVRAACPEVTK
jgi:RNA polymerase sigma-70 factor, ECF subfamily